MKLYVGLGVYAYVVYILNLALTQVVYETLCRSGFVCAYVVYKL